MIDLNALISSALAAAVAEAIKPLAARVAELEAVQARAVNPATVAEHGGQLAGLAEHLGDRLGTVQVRLDALEAKLTEAQLFQKTTEVTVPIDEARLVEVLDQQEWFWEKLTRKAGEAAQAVADEAINDHCDTYNHDDYDSAAAALDDYDLDSIVTEDNLRDEIKQVLRDVTISLDV